MRYILSAILLLFSCTTLPENIPGCTNSNACNFNPEANEDDGSCAIVPDMCGICNNDSSDDCVQDCAGIWGGSTVASFCEICISNTGEFDCSGNCCKNDLIYDINSLLSTSTSCSIEDKCGICNGDGWKNGLPCDDLFALQQIIDANDFSITPSAQNEIEFHAWDLNANGLVDPLEFGVQNWSDEGRLIYLKVDIPIIITDNIGALTELTELILDASGLTAIPETIGNLQKLKLLSIASNSISLLPEKIVDLVNLEVLLISSNNILYLPGNIGNLTKLIKLDVANNMLTTLPDNIGSLNQLTNLFLENNQINVLPATFADLSNLIELRLYSNKLVELPESFGEFDDLLDLYLNNNQLSKLSDNFGSMNNLERLRLNSNKLDSVPVSIVNMSNLEQLWLQNNQLANLPDEIGVFDSLVILKIDNNILESIPGSVGSLESLKELNLDYNELISLPGSLCDIYNDFDFFSVSNNKLCPGSYPICLTETVNGGSQICGGCPPHFFFIEGYCAWESDYNILQNFLDMNPESQSLPGSAGVPENASHCVNEYWWDSGRLVEITFQHKQLTSIIPESLGLLDKLEILRLTGNHLIGEIPDGITNLTNLKILKLSSNFLEGPIPENIGALTRLDSIMLSDNLFTGSIPSSIGSMTNIKYLYFDGNLLTGSIPETIGDLEKIVNLYLDNNKLTGEIPSNIGNLLSLGRLYLLNNCLTGPIPAEMCNIYSYNPDFRSMLHNNQFVQPYPDCIKDTHLGNQLTDCPY